MRTDAPFRAALVTADADARARLRPLLTADPDLELVADARPGRTAAEILRARRPDVLLVDADDYGDDGTDEAGGAATGFRLLASVAHMHRPQSIFLARSEAFAAQAFEVGAVDYLLAPYPQDRLRAALDRFKQRARAEGVERLNRQLSAVLGRLGGDRSPAPPPNAAYVERIPVREHDLVRFVPVRDVVWIEAAGNYVLLHADGRSHMLLETMQHLERRLDPARFLRIHRSRIVNLDHVEALTPLPYGEYRLHLRTGGDITSSRSRSPALAEALGID